MPRAFDQMMAVGAGNPVTVIDLVFPPGPEQGKFGIWLRGSRALRHLESRGKTPGRNG